jgi:tetratricopeptide (TPR) repeat protein
MNALSSWDEYLQAVNSYALMNAAKTTEEKLLNIAKSIEHGEKATALDPNHSSAFNLLAQAYNFLIFESSVQDKRTENEKKFREYTEKAFQLDPQNPDSIMNMGFMAFFDEDKNRFTDYVNKALEVNPHHSRSLMAKGMNLLEEGKDFNAAIDAFTRAAEVDPLGEDYGETVIFFCHLGNRDWDSANQSLDREMRENNHSRYFGFKAAVLAHQGKVSESKEWLLKYQKERPEIKTIDDYKSVAPDLNNEIKELMIEGMRLAGMPE